MNSLVNKERSRISSFLNSRVGRGLAIAAFGTLAATISEGRPATANASSNIFSEASTAASFGSDPETCWFKFKGFSVFLKSEPPKDIQQNHIELTRWAIENNQIRGPAPDRSMDVSINRTGDFLATITTDADGIGLTKDGRSILKADAPIEKGVERFFNGKWWKMALVNVYDKTTDRTHAFLMYCYCLNNQGVPRWNKDATPTLAPTSTLESTPQPTQTPIPKPTNICPPVQVQIPCRTKEALLNPVQEDIGEEVEVGRVVLNDQSFSFMMPRKVYKNLYMEAA